MMPCAIPFLFLVIKINEGTLITSGVNTEHTVYILAWRFHGCWHLILLPPHYGPEQKKTQNEQPSNQQSPHAKRVVPSSQMSEGCEGQSEQTSEWPSISVCIFGCSGPLCQNSIKTLHKKSFGLRKVDRQIQEKLKL